jgi:hypothetical protein
MIRVLRLIRSIDHNWLGFAAAYKNGSRYPALRKNIMHPNTRACVAFIAGKIISGSGNSSVYDYSQSKYINISGSVSATKVSAYDHDRGCHFGGNLPSLYDYGRSVHVSLEINGQDFKGYDYGDSQHFTGKVNGRSVSFYDYGESQYFNYSV